MRFWSSFRKKKKIYECSLEGCSERTDGVLSKNPRNRWILGITIGDEEESAIINLCPTHVRELFSLNEQDYNSLQLGEGLATNRISTEEWKNAISRIN